MKSLNYWQEFTNTGKIGDYLSYIDLEKTAEYDKEGQAACSGEYPYAGIHMCDRNHTEAGAFRGL